MATSTIVFAGMPAKKIDSLKVVNLQEVQVVSTRAAGKTPMAYSNISQKVLKSQNFGQDIPFLLLSTPSVVTSSDAGTGIGYTSIRVRGTDPSRINITANGIPINDAESNVVYWVNMPDFASNLGSIQIQRGVGTSTNGGGAFGASINMQTEDITLKPYAEISTSGGSYGTHKETLKFGTGLLNQHWAIDGSLSNIGSDGYIRRAWSKLNSYFLQAGYFNKNTIIKFITFNGSEQTYHAWDYASKAQMDMYGRRYNPDGEYYNGTDTLYYKNQIDNYHQQNYQLLWNQILSSKWYLNIALHYTHGFGYYEQYKVGQSLNEYNLTSQLGTESDLIRQADMKNDFYGTVYSLNYRSSKLDASIGGGLSQYDGDHYGNVIWIKNFEGSLLPNYEYYRNNGKKTDGNIYGKVNYEIINGVNGYLDLQYRYINYKLSGPTDKYDKNEKQESLNINNKFNFFNPKVGLYWNINKYHTLYSSYAVTHKEPNRSNYEDNIGTMPKAERLSDWEIGYKYSSAILTASANFYYMNYHDQLVGTGAVDDNGYAILKNVGRSYREGIELSLGFRPTTTSPFRFDGNLTLSHNRAKGWTVTPDDTKDIINLGNTPLAFSPNIILNNALTFSKNGWNASLQGQYIGKQYLTNTGFKSYTEDGKDISMMLDSYFVTNLSLDYTFKLPHIKSITAGVTVYNLLSEKYESNGLASAQFKSDGKGGVIAYQDAGQYSYAVFSAQAPANFIARLSISF